MSSLNYWISEYEHNWLLFESREWGITSYPSKCSLTNQQGRNRGKDAETYWPEQVILSFNRWEGEEEED